jgi:hypothetical protein
LPSVCVIVALAGCGRLNFDDVSPQADALPDSSDDPAPRFAGLVARYSMEDDPGDAEIDDVGGNGLVGRCIAGSTCPTTVEGRFGNALQFDGNAQIVRITHDPQFATPDAFTLAAWVFLDVSSPLRAAVGKAQGGGDSNSWNLWSTNVTTCTEAVTATGQILPCQSAPLPLGRWTHLLERWDGSTVELHIDGVLAVATSVGEPLLFDDHEVTIGADVDFGSAVSHWPGRIDEVQFYGRALDSSEIGLLSAP